MSSVIYLYIYIVIPYLLVLVNSSLYYLYFCSVTVILLHCGSFCHENKFLVCVNIPGNKADSDSDSYSDHVAECGTCSQRGFQYIANINRRECGVLVQRSSSFIMTQIFKPAELTGKRLLDQYG